MIRFFVGICLLVSLQQVKAQSKIEVDKKTTAISTQVMVIRNKTMNTRGYLFNTGDGKTDFRKTGKAIQFSVGSNGFPVNGANSYTDPSLTKKYIKVWRNGLLQKTSTQQGINIDNVAGKITFYPVLVQAEKIYIEALEDEAFSL